MVLVEEALTRLESQPDASEPTKLPRNKLRMSYNSLDKLASFLNVNGKTDVDANAWLRAALDGDRKGDGLHRWALHRGRVDAGTDRRCCETLLHCVQFVGFRAMNTPKSKFESNALATFERAKSTIVGRGNEYGDTWRECNFLKMKAVARAIGYEIKQEHFRALATAAFSDMKYWGNLGGFKDDSLVDGINYDASLAEEMRALLASQAELPPHEP